MQSAEKLAPERGVDDANGVGIQKREPSVVGVRPRERFLRDRDLLLGAHEGDGAGWAVSDAGDTGGKVCPQFARAQRSFEFVRGSPGYPDEAEVPYRGTAGFGLTFEMDDVVSPTDCLVGVRRSEDPSAHNQNSHVEIVTFGLDQ